MCHMEKTAASPPMPKPSVTARPGPTAGSSFVNGPQGAVSSHAYRWPVLLSLLGLLTVLSFHYAVRLGVAVPTLWIYWFGLLLTLLPGLVSRNRLATIFSVGAFIFLQSFCYALAAPYGYVYSRDPIYNMQAAQIMLSNQSWSVGLGSYLARAYTYYPGSNLYHVALAETMGLSLDKVYLFGTDAVRFVVIPISLFGIFRRFLRETPSLVGIAAYFAIPSYLFNLPAQEEFAISFALLGLYAALLAPVLRTRYAFHPGALLAAFAFVGLVAVSHHFTSYVFLGVFAVFAVVCLLGRRKTREPKPAGRAGSLSRTLGGALFVAPAFAYLFLMWSAFVSLPLDLYWVDYAVNTFGDVFSSGPGGLSNPGGTGGRGVQPGYTYTQLELYLMLGSVVVLAVTALFGVFLLLRRTSQANRTTQASRRGLLLLLVIAVFLAAAASPLIFSRGLFVPLRVMEFAGIGVIPPSALLLAAWLRSRSAAKTLVALALVSVLIVGGSLVQIANPRYEFIPARTQFCEIPQHVTPDVLEAVQWARDHINASSRVIGDELAIDAFGGFGQFEVAPQGFPSYPLFNASVLNKSLATYLRLRVGDVIVVDRYMLTSICFASFRTTPFNPAQLAKFDYSPAMTKVFANDAVKIYRWQGFT